MDTLSNWKPWAWAAGFIVLLLVGWGTYKVMIADHAVADAKLEKDFNDQKDSTKAWKDKYKVVEDARRNLHDTLNILSGLAHTSELEAARWHDSATHAKRQLILIQRPSLSDSTNPRWMHRAIQLETIVAAQDKENSNKDTQLALAATQQKLLLSQMSKDSVALYSANGDILRLDKLVDEYKDKASCKVAWILPCLSRTQSFVAGAIASGIGSVLVNRSRKK